jgi:putative copper export protein
MNLQKLISMTSRLFFLGAFVLFGLALIERGANATGYTILDQTTSTVHLLAAAVVLLVFVIAIQLREMKEELKGRRP